MVKVTLRLNQTHRKVYGKIAIEFALLTVGGLVVSQLFLEKDLSSELIYAGVVVFLIGFLISYKLLKGVKKGGGD